MSEEVSQTELLESHAESIRASMRVGLPARVKKYNGDGTVQVELMINQIGQNNQQFVIPLLSDVPIQMLSYGPFSIVAEPQDGDEGLVHFADRCIDGWWESGNKSIPLDSRMHDLSDAFFAPGYKSKPKALSIVQGAMNIGNESTYVRIKDDGTIEIKGATTFTDEVTAPNFKTTAGLSLNDHTHGNVQNGSGSTGKPQ